MSTVFANNLDKFGYPSIFKNNIYFYCISFAQIFLTLQINMIDYDPR